MNSNNSALDKVRMADIPTEEQLMDAIEHTKGFVHAATRYLYEQYGLHVSGTTISRLIRKYNIGNWVHDMQAAPITECLKKKSGK